MPTLTTAVALAAVAPADHRSGRQAGAGDRGADGRRRAGRHGDHRTVDHDPASSAVPPLRGPVAGHRGGGRARALGSAEATGVGHASCTRRRGGRRRRRIGVKGCRQGRRAMPTLRWCSRPATLAVHCSPPWRARRLHGGGGRHRPPDTSPPGSNRPGGDGGTRVVFTEGLEPLGARDGSAVRSGARVAVSLRGGDVRARRGRRSSTPWSPPALPPLRTCRWIASTAVGRCWTKGRAAGTTVVHGRCRRGVRRGARDRGKPLMRQGGMR